MYFKLMRLGVTNLSIVVKLHNKSEFEHPILTDSKNNAEIDCCVSAYCRNYFDKILRQFLI